MDDFPSRVSVPRLLVSVRDAVEARAALRGGCDILDVKEPTRGSLGMADPVRLCEVIDTARHECAGVESQAAAVHLSSALGEAVDWARAEAVPRLPAPMQFAKLGLAGLARSADWCRAWGEVRQRFEESAGRRLEWVAVVYADWTAAQAPQPATVIEAAVRTGCRIVLFDTWRKDGRTLFDCLPFEVLHGLTKRVCQSGLRVALAGRLTKSTLPQAAAVQPEIVAIRSAACAGERRNAEVSTRAVSDFKRAMLRVLTERRAESQAASRAG